MKIKYLVVLALLSPTLTFAKGINVTKDEFISEFCKYLNNPEVKTETKICPVKIKQTGSDSDSFPQIGYSFKIPNGSSVSFGVDKKTKKVTGVSFEHSTDIAGSDDVMQTRYAIISTIDNDLYKNHDEDFYNLISARKTMRAGMKTPVEHMSLEHNGIHYQYTYDDMDSDFSFQIENQ
ncbi:hypothetical protein [Klebsiella aerogenes]|uniref:hypothetical protein n=1 Tax=Klebsiella aerogenes TaxID=548 RepID=UPI00351D4D75